MLFLFCLVPHSSGSEKRLKFDRVVDLGGNIAQAFRQDNDGFLWIGGLTNGLFRYDGYTPQNYGIGPGLLANGNITEILEDSHDQNILWIATLDGGFSRFDKETAMFTNYTFDPNKTDGLAMPLVYDIVQDRQHPNTLWIVGDTLFQKFEQDTEIFSPNILDSESAAMLDDTQFFSIIEDSANPDILWISAWGLVKFEKSTQTFTVYSYDPENSSGLGFEPIGSMTQDKDDPNILWLGYWDGPILDKFDITTETFTHYVHDPDEPQSLRDGAVQLIYDDGEGTLWLGGWGDPNGLTAFDKQSQVFTTYTHIPKDPHSLSSDMIVNVFKDRSGILWIANTNGKIDKYDRHNQNFTLYQHNPVAPNSLVNDSVSSMYEDPDGLIWFGTEGGLSQLDPHTGSFTNYTHNPQDIHSLDGNNVLCTYQDSSGDFWVGLYNRPLLKFDKHTGRVLERIELPEGSGIAEIREDPNDPNILWLGVVYNVGFAQYNKASRQLTYYPPDPGNYEKGVNAIEITEVVHDNEEDVIWLGAWNGNALSRFDTKTETFSHYFADPNNPKKLSYNSIGAMYQDSSGVLWIGTLGGGLNKFEKDTDTFTRYGMKHGVPSVVNAILEDAQGNLWLSTDHGIIRFNPKEGTVDTHYIKSDGLQGDAFSYGCRLKTKDGRLWFGGTNGANSFHPDQLTQNSYIPPVILTALTQGGERVNWGHNKVPERVQQITLDWKADFFEFEYAALNYTIPEKNQYKFMLEGLDKDWYHAGTRRTGRYVGIPAGEYTLKIVGSNNDGKWNDAGIALTVTVIPPFWKTTWFFALCVIGTFLLFFAIFYYRTRQLHTFNKILKQRLDKRTEQLNKANKAIVKLEKEQLERQMAGGFAHEMRNALVGVSIGLDVVIEDEETVCQKNSEALGMLYDTLKVHIPEEKMEAVIDTLQIIDKNEETLDTILQETKKCTTHALEVTKLILEYSRLGRTEAGKDRMKISEILARLLKEHAARFAEQGISLNMQGTASGILRAHTPHIHSIFNNLVLNARDALLEVHDERERFIEMAIQEDIQKQIITIKDNANGIPQENIEKIFDPFFSTKPATGTGLGLNFVAKLVKLYNGSIDVNSQINKGTTFTLTFPV